MFKSIKRAKSAGWRAGMIPNRLVRPGGTRGVKIIQPPLNPYRGELGRSYRPLLAMAWDSGFVEAKLEKLSTL